MASLNKPRGLRMVVGDDDPFIGTNLGGFHGGQGSGNQVMSSEGVNKPKPWFGNNALQETHVTRLTDHMPSPPAGGREMP